MARAAAGEYSAATRKSRIGLGWTKKKAAQRPRRRHAPGRLLAR
jgi:hypothetical protein